MLSFTFAVLASMPLLLDLLIGFTGGEGPSLPDSALLASIGWGALAIWAELRREK